MGSQEIKIADMFVEYIHHCGSDLTTVNAARQSFSRESTELNQADINLINFLAREEHTSPFHHAFISFKVRCPISVARQLVKHEYLIWNEESRRYIADNVPPTFYMVDYFRPKADNVKQGSEDVILTENEMAIRFLTRSYQQAYDAYLNLLTLGVCPEQARLALPQGMNVNFWWSGTVGAMCSMLAKRLASDTQKETRIVAKMILGHIIKYFPETTTAYVNHMAKQKGLIK